ncbi:hypothetical protein ACS0TY_029938 [Phlomoides rotata]
MLAWSLWKARNKRCFDGTEQSPCEIVSEALAAVEETQPTRGMCTGTDWSRPSAKKWTPPPHGQLKLNSDAGVFSDGTVGLGFVVRDSTGKMVLAGAR